MTDSFIENGLKTARYKFARTMPDFPHDYTLRDTWNSKKQFIKTVEYIRLKGQRERFFNNEFIYFYLDGYKYWTMGAPVHQTILINRANDNNNRKTQSTAR